MKKMRSLTTPVLVLLFFVLVCGFIAFYFLPSDLSAPVISTQPTEHLKAYHNETFGFSFEYPEKYILLERYGTGTTTVYYSVELMDAQSYEDSKNRTSGEGPTSIIFEIFKPKELHIPPLKWATENKESNFNLTKGSYTTREIAGKDALSYSWDGLYTADSVVFQHKNNILFATVTYFNPHDSKRQDFQHILHTLEFLK